MVQVLAILSIDGFHRLLFILMGFFVVLDGSSKCIGCKKRAVLALLRQTSEGLENGFRTDALGLIKALFDWASSVAMLPEAMLVAQRSVMY